MQMRIKRIHPQEVLALAPRDSTPRISVYANSPAELAARLQEQEASQAESPHPTLARGMREIRKVGLSLSWPGPHSSVGIFYHPHGSGFAELPFRSASLLVVADSFHIKPILKWAQRDRPFLLLYLAIEDGLIYEGTYQRLRRHPKGLGGGSAARRTSWGALVRQIRRLARDSGRPVVIMGPSRNARRIESLLDPLECVVADPLPDPEDAKLADLHQASLAALEPFWNKRQQRQVEDYWEAKPLGKTCSKLYQIVELSNQGRIAHLFVNESLMVWTQSSAGQIRYLKDRPACGDDLLDDLSETVLSAGGAVTVLNGDQMPESQAAAAIVRSSRPA